MHLIMVSVRLLCVLRGIEVRLWFLSFCHSSFFLVSLILRSVWKNKIIYLRFWGGHFFIFNKIVVKKIVSIGLSREIKIILCLVKIPSFGSETGITALEGSNGRCHMGVVQCPDYLGTFSAILTRFKGMEGWLDSRNCRKVIRVDIQLP